MTETSTAAGQLSFELEHGERRVGPTFGQWYRAQPPHFDRDWSASQWAGRLTASYHAHLAQHNMLAPALTGSGTSTHGGEGE